MLSVIWKKLTHALSVAGSKARLPTRQVRVYWPKSVLAAHTIETIASIRLGCLHTGRTIRTASTARLKQIATCGSACMWWITSTLPSF